MTKNIKVSAIVSAYNSSKYLPAFLDNAAAQVNRGEVEIVLVYNDPSHAETELIHNFQSRFPGLVSYLPVPREKLAVSMNRCIKAAAGEYVCIWNIDDLRTPDSLKLQADFLDSHPALAFTYGNFMVVHEWLAQTGKTINSPEFEKNEFRRSMHLGPFYMWRKSLCKQIGYFDEQCKQGADFEYAVRLATEHEGGKAQGLLGYYLDEGLGLSTRRNSLRPVEDVFIQLRYGVYRKMDFWYYTKAKRYNIGQVLTDGQWMDIDKLSPHRRQYMEIKLWIVYGVLRYPFWMVKRIINKLMKSYGKF